MTKHSSVYDYTNQAWVKDGRYVSCGHPKNICFSFDHGHTMANTRSDCKHQPAGCPCYGRLHKGETAKIHLGNGIGPCLQLEGPHVAHDCPVDQREGAKA